MSEIKGTIATEGKINGTLNVASGFDGKSAYEIAIENGFEGTEAEWLESLHGKDGIDGNDGKKGDTGNSGVYLGSGEMPDDCNVQIDPEGDVVINDFVLTTEQNLTKEQQAQARENIGAIDLDTIHPRLLVSQIAHKTGIKRLDSRTDDFRIFVDVYQAYDNGSKCVTAMYGLTEQPLYSASIGTSNKQEVYKSVDGGNTWEKLGELGCFTPADISTLGSWYISLFVDATGENFYFLRTNDGLKGAQNTIVSGYFSGGTFYSIGSLEIGTRTWLSNTNNIDCSPSADWSNRVVMFGEYGTGLYDSDPTYRIWRTNNSGATWTPCLEIQGDSGSLGTGEIRHFHCVQRDPYNAGHWWAAAGDENHQCKIFRTTDDGLNWEQIFPLPGVAGTQQERTCSFAFDKNYVYYGMDTPTVGKDNVKIFRIDKSKIGTTDENGNPIDPREVVATVDSGYPVYCLTKCEYPEGFLVWTVFEKSTNNITNRHVVEFYDFVTQKLYPVAKFDTSDAMAAGYDYVGFTSASRYTDRFTGVSVVKPHFSMQQAKYGYGSVSRHIKVQVTT